MVAPNVLVGIPVPPWETVIVPAPDLDKTHAPLQETPGGEALLRKMKCLLRLVDFGRPFLGTFIQSVMTQDMLWLLLEAQCIRRAQLHFGCHLITPDPPLQPGILGMPRRMIAVEPCEIK